MTDDVLQASIRAIRVDGDDRLLADATRHRIQRSLVRRARGRRRLMQSSLVVAVLLVSGLSWAVSTGRLSFRSAPVVEPHEPAPAPTPRGLVAPARPHVTAPVVVVEEPREEHRIEEPREPRMAIAPRVVEAKQPAETLYRAAHELHFHGADHAAALAAWEAYLAAEPSGRFAIEARYNRALILVRLRRFADARAALAPYASGEIAGGYRQAEARQIVERLEALNGSKPSGDYGR